MNFNVLISLVVHIFLILAFFVSLPVFKKETMLNFPSVPVELIFEETIEKKETKFLNSTSSTAMEDKPASDDQTVQKSELVDNQAIDPLIDQKPEKLNHEVKPLTIEPKSSIIEPKPLTIEPKPLSLKEKKENTVQDPLPTKDSLPLQETSTASFLQHTSDVHAAEKGANVVLPKTAPVPFMHDNIVAKEKVEKKEKILDHRMTDLLKSQKLLKNALHKDTINKKQSHSDSQNFKGNQGEKLSENEMEVLRQQIQKQIQMCWNIPSIAADAEKRIVSIRFKLTREGEVVDGSPHILSGGGDSGVERALGESARRAILKCAPYKLPVEKYSAWEEVTVNFDPSVTF